MTAPDLWTLVVSATPVAVERGSHLLGGSFANQPVPTMAILAALSLAPFALLLFTSFSKIAVVLSIARSAFGTQQTPPTTVLTGLALILTLHVMAPTFEEMWREGGAAFSQAHSGPQLVAAVSRAAVPLRLFLLKHAHAEDRHLFVQLGRELRRDQPGANEVVFEDDMAVIAPAFLISELREAFQMGFLIFLPFLVLDMVVANLLLALGMQSLSPSTVSLPFKLLLFVSVDGWHLLAQGLVLGYR